MNKTKLAEYTQKTYKKNLPDIFTFETTNAFAEETQLSQNTLLFQTKLVHTLTTDTVFSDPFPKKKQAEDHACKLMLEKLTNINTNNISFSNDTNLKYYAHLGSTIYSTLLSLLFNQTVPENKKTTESLHIFLTVQKEQNQIKKLALSLGLGDPSSPGIKHTNLIFFNFIWSTYVNSESDIYKTMNILNRIFIPILNELSKELNIPIIKKRKSVE
eukprot:snap_masked-scaffold_44-processed-gene-1.88-mRNA-1 protein AED:0.99 eAED:1.00 QI:0/-1/0/1/-1/1/1/0/214